MTLLFHRPQHRITPRLLRCGHPTAQALLWKRLRSRQVAGAKFRRQHGIENYVLDFFCPEVGLALQLDRPSSKFDGLSHDSEAALVYDAQRQQHIESSGTTFLRFNNRQVMENIEQVVEAISVKVEELRMERGEV